MTRAALLHLFDSPEALPTAVQELEQLAQAFPYCQTAHLLLAKAAHDQGSMLAGQRLRRAATYAADRHLLRLLLERPAPQPVEAEVSAFAPPQEPSVVELAENSKEDEAFEALADVPAIEPVASEEVALVVPEPLPVDLTPVVAAELVNEPQAELSRAEELITLESAETREEEAVSTVVVALEQTPEASLVLQDETPPETVSQVVPVLALDNIEATSSGGEEPAGVELPEPKEDVIAEQEAAPLPIRPPVEAGTARFEFGLNKDLEMGFSAYQLPELLSEDPAAPVRIAPATTNSFLGSADLAYALGGGSRFGYALQPLPEATMDAEQPVAETPGEMLPPAGEFFAPDALVLEHLASQPLPTPAAPSSFDLIDSFLRRAPQRRRGIVTLLTVPEQADLSIRSTQAESGLASESLARILAGQGKIDRAITVYERLMVRQPEKSAYFAVQIELLRNPPTPSS